MEKTCGTCEHWWERPGKKVGVCPSCRKIILCTPWLPAKPYDRECDCGHYTERTDSIEQVAREMFVDLKMEAAEGEGLYDEDVIHEYRDRLTALGVEV